MGYIESNQGLAKVLNISTGGVDQFLAKTLFIKKREAARKAEGIALKEQTAAARRQQIDLLSQAEAAAAEQANLTLRAAAERKAADLADNPLEDADVQLAEKPTETATATRAKKRKQFGFDTSGYSPGAKL